MLTQFHWTTAGACAWRTHSPLGAQPQSDRILRVLCGRLVWQVTNHWLVCKWQVGVQVAGWLLLTLPL